VSKNTLMVCLCVCVNIESNTFETTKKIISNLDTFYIYQDKSSTIYPYDFH